MQKYLLLFQAVRVNYQSWISVPIGQSVACVHALLSNRISLLLERSLSKLRAQGCYIKEATIRRKSSSHPQGSSLRADLRRQPCITVFSQTHQKMGGDVAPAVDAWVKPPWSIKTQLPPRRNFLLRCCGTLHVGSRTKPRKSGG